MADAKERARNVTPPELQVALIAPATEVIDASLAEQRTPSG